MSKKKKNGNQNCHDTVILVTEILSLIVAIIDLIKALIE